MLRIQKEEAVRMLKEKAMKNHFSEAEAQIVAETLVDNALDGVYSHGINRFPSLIGQVLKGDINIGGKPELINAFGGIENYDGGGGLGVPNGLYCADRAAELAKEHGVGVVSIRNTNHWLRGATYGYRIMKQGMAAICMTNSISSMPTWGAEDIRLGNNPYVMAFPYSKGDIIVDFAQSQFSYGALEVAMLEDRELVVDGGYNKDGEITRQPKEIYETHRLLPMGYWKGAGFAFLIDCFAAGFSMGNTCSGIDKLGGNRDVCQTYMAFNYQKIAPQQQSEPIIDDLAEYVLGSRMIDGLDIIPFTNTDHIIYTGQLAIMKREDQLKNGVLVHEKIWDQVNAL